MLAPYLPGKTTTLTLSVKGLITTPNFSQDNIQRFVDLLAKQGIQIEVVGSGEGFGYNISRTPPNLSSQQITDTVNTAYKRAFSSYVEGPWNFTYPLP